MSMLIQSELKSVCVINSVKITKSQLPTLDMLIEGEIAAVILHSLILLNSVR